jgi:transposase
VPFTYGNLFTGVVPNAPISRGDTQRRRFICEQIRSIEQERLERLKRTADTKPHAMVRLLARITSVGIETADLLVHEMLLRNMRDRRATTGSPDAVRQDTRRGTR